MNPLNALKSLLFNGLDILYPPHCVHCGELLPERCEEDLLLLCGSCVSDWIPHEKMLCLKCGTFLSPGPETPDEDAIYDDDYGLLPEAKPFRAKCLRCVSRNFQFDRVLPLGEYEASLREVVLRMKKDKTGHLATQAASLLYRQYREDIHAIGAELVVPIPMHAIRRFVRGVNSPEFVAAEFARRLDRPISRKIVRRTRATKPQFDLKPNQRSKNVRDAFAFSGPPEAVQDKTILLVDDILTTGSTSNEVTKLFLENGAKKVVVCVLARSAIQNQSGKR